jgi:hypothetical protein
MMSIYRVSLLCLIYFGILCHQSLLACTCLPIHTFCETVDRFLEWDPENTLVVRGTIIEKIKVGDYRTDRLIHIDESFYNPAGLTEIRIREGNGADCGRSLEEFSIGDELIFVTSVWMDTTNLGSFSICTPAPLQLVGNQVRGRITRDHEQSITLDAFRRLSECHLEVAEFVHFPNPASDIVYFEHVGQGQAPGIVNIEVYDITGQKIHDQPVENGAYPTRFMLGLDKFPSGQYYARVRLVQGYERMVPITIVH